MGKFTLRYGFPALGAALVAATLAPAAQPFRVNVNLSNNRQPSNWSAGAFFFNPWVFENAREQSIMFNRSLLRNQPVPPMNASGMPFSATSNYVPGTNPFYAPYAGAPTLAQQSLNIAMLGRALQSVPPGALPGVGSPLLTSGYPYGGYGYGGGGYPSLSGSPYGGGYGGSPYGGGYGGSPSGYMSGGTGALGDSSSLLTSYVDDPLTRQLEVRGRLDNRRRAFDEYLYERLNSPTHEDLREFTQHEALRRSLNEPPTTEVWSGRSLNTLLRDVQKLQGVNKDSVPEITLDEDLVKRLNVTASNGRGGNMGFLKDGGKLVWPLGLRVLPPSEETRELRSQVETLLQDGVAQAANGKVDPGLLLQLTRDVDRLQRLLLARANDLPEDTYIEARQFLNNLDSAVRLLRRPDAGDYISGRFAAKGSTVQKLVKYMTEHGLQFAAGVPGDEAAYTAVHRALARYDSALRTNELRNDSAAKEPGARNK